MYREWSVSGKEKKFFLNGLSNVSKHTHSTAQCRMIVYTVAVSDPSLVEFSDNPDATQHLKGLKSHCWPRILLTTGPISGPVVEPNPDRAALSHISGRTKIRLKSKWEPLMISEVFVSTSMCHSSLPG